MVGKGKYGGMTASTTKSPIFNKDGGGEGVCMDLLDYLGVPRQFWVDFVVEKNEDVRLSHKDRDDLLNIVPY